MGGQPNHASIAERLVVYVVGTRVDHLMFISINDVCTNIQISAATAQPSAISLERMTTLNNNNNYIYMMANPVNHCTPTVDFKGARFGPLMICITPFEWCECALGLFIYVYTLNPCTASALH